MIKHTLVTFGRIGVESAKAEMARAGTVGGQVMSFEHMVERLAGGFLRTVDMTSLREASACALEEADIGELNAIRSMPGMARATASSLMAWWMSGLNAKDYDSSPRMRAVFALEEAVEAFLPNHMRKPADIVALACANADHANAIFGKVVFSGMTDLHPVWRPVLEAMCRNQDFRFVWDCGPTTPPSFLEALPAVNKEIWDRNAEKPTVKAETFSDIHHEVIEALRWANGLLAAGVPGKDIAIAAASVATYEATVATVARYSDVDLYLAGGLPALMTPEGQECAALADVLVRGISVKRIRRLVDAAGENEAFLGLPQDWISKFPKDASLKTLDRWVRLLSRNDLGEERRILEPIVTLLDRGVAASAEAGRELLSQGARRIWERALKSGPASAVDLTLKTLRAAPQGTSLDKVTFMSAGDLVAAPRSHVRLVGLSSGLWPRRDAEDALIPGYVVPTRVLSPMSRTEIDRRDFDTIVKGTSAEVVLSWSRTDAQGRLTRPSGIVSRVDIETHTHLERTDKRPFPMSRSDLMFMRPLDYSKTTDAVRSKMAVLDWERPTLTEHDGLVPASHPRIEAAFAQIQSATSLRLMIRDPLAYMWKYALGFHSPEFEDEPLTVDSRTFGNIVHEILKTVVRKLEKGDGFTAASDNLLKVETQMARMRVGAWFEQSRPVPPTLIWATTLDLAEEIAYKALTFREARLEGARSYAEIPFGKNVEYPPDSVPWVVDRDVEIPGTGIRVGGIMDRLDLLLEASTAHVLDYKTGKTPTGAETIGIAGGKEVQRTIYYHALKALLDGVDTVISALYYPATGTYVPLENTEQHVEDVAMAIRAALLTLRNGHAYPGIDAADTYNDMLFAYPERARSVYLERKMALIGTEFEELIKVWDMK